MTCIMKKNGEYEYKIGGAMMEKNKEEIDLGVCVNELLKLSFHVANFAAGATVILGKIYYLHTG